MLRARARARLALLGAAALACATVPGSDTEKLALDSWRRADFSGIAVYTNAKADKARYPTERLQLFVELVSSMVLRHGFSAGRPAVIYLFAREDQYRMFGSAYTQGHALAGDDGYAISMSLARDGIGLTADNTAVLQHEVVHLLLQNDERRRYPAWFHEGLAEFLGATVIRSDLATIGGMPPDRRLWLRRREPLPLERILSSPHAVQQTYLDTLSFYADAWAFVHYGLLSHGMGGPKRSRQFMEFVMLTAEGADWRSAMETAFPVPLEQIETEFARHRGLLADAAIHPQAHLEIPLPEALPSFEAVGETEMARQLGSYALEHHEERQDRTAVSLFDSVLRSSPRDHRALIGSVRARSRLGDLEAADASWAQLPVEAREEPGAREAAGDLALAHYEALRAEDRVETGAPWLEQARAAYTRVLEQSPDRRGTLLAMGRTYVVDDTAVDLAPGIEALERAVVAAPREAAIRLDLARLYLRAEMRDQARIQLRWVIAALPSGTRIVEEAEALLADAAT